MIKLQEIKDMTRLMKWREEVIKHVFSQEPNEDLLAANRQYYETHISGGNHVAFEATIDDEEAGCGGVCFTEELPSPDNPSGKCAYLMNIYVREQYRQHGVAHDIVNRLIEVAKERGCCKIYLETTDEGRPVYTSVGFQDMPDMMKYYE